MKNLLHPQTAVEQEATVLRDGPELNETQAKRTKKLAIVFAMFLPVSAFAQSGVTWELVEGGLTSADLALNQWEMVGMSSSLEPSGGLVVVTQWHRGDRTLNTRCFDFYNLRTEFIEGFCEQVVRKND